VEHDTTFNAGLLINPAGKFSLGVVFKKGGEFSFDATSSQRIRLETRPEAGLTFAFRDEAGNLVLRFVDGDWCAQLQFECNPVPTRFRLERQPSRRNSTWSLR
jgi:hypothetical protein